MLMETLSRWIGGVNDVLWTYVLVAALLGCAVCRRAPDKTGY